MFNRGVSMVAYVSGNDHKQPKDTIEEVWRSIREGENSHARVHNISNRVETSLRPQICSVYTFSALIKYDLRYNVVVVWTDQICQFCSCHIRPPESIIIFHSWSKNSNFKHGTTTENCQGQDNIDYFFVLTKIRKRMRISSIWHSAEF
jgi:hypothetical protein